MSIFSSVEFYVIAVMVAAAIVAFLSRPHRTGAVRQHLLPTELSMNPDDNGQQSLTISVDNHYNVVITRHGIPDLTEAGALSLAVEVAGFDITVKERITRDARPASAVNTASVTLDFLAPERYHLHYYNPETERAAATPLPVKPGIKITKHLV